MDADIANAVNDVKRAWGDESAWARLEEAAATLNRPTDAADLYREALGVSHSKDVLERIARRAVSFFEEWFGDEPEAVNEIFSKIVEVDPTALWAFERLTEFMTVRERWDDLFAAYDRMLTQDLSMERRKSLLEEVSNIAKDIADKPEKALVYLMPLQALDKENIARFRVIERMLERQEQWGDLIVLLNGQKPLMESDEARETWLRIADCYVGKLEDLERGYAELKEFLGEYPGDAEACAAVQKLLEDDRTALSLKMDGMQLLIDTHDASGSHEAAIATVESVIPFADPPTAVSLHRMAGNRLALLSKDEEAIGHYASLLLLEPGDADALKNLRILSVRAKRPDLRAAALVKAAESSPDDGLRVTHTLDAARIYSDDLNERSKAIALLQSVLDIEDVDPSTALVVSHKLNELFAAEGLREERLSVLEQIAELERTHALRRTVIVEAARLAEELGDTDRALASWRGLLETTPDDREAVSAVVDLLERTEDYEALTKTLERRSEMGLLPEQRRRDLVRAAVVYRDKLEDPAQATILWRKVFDEFGPRQDAIDALDRLLSEASQLEALDTLLSRSVTDDFDRMKQLFLRRADINAASLNKPEQAFELYHQVLVIEPDSDRAIEGIQKLLTLPALARRAVDALVTAHRRTDNWSALIELTQARLDSAESDAARIPIFLEAASLQKNRANNPEAARDLLTRLLPLDPENQKIEAEMMRLARAHGGWNRTGLALGHAASALFDNPKRRAHLKFLEGQVLESELNKDAGALAAYTEVIQLDPRNPEVLIALCRVAARLFQWDRVAEALLSLIVLTDSIDKEHLDGILASAKENDQLKDLLDALEEALTRQRRIRTSLKRQLETDIALGYLQGCDDPISAEKAALHAVAADSQHLASLKLLADIQRKNASVGLTQTLQTIFDQKDNDLDPLREAAESALELLSDPGEQRRHLLRLHEASSAMWRLGKRAVGEHSIESCCHFATWAIVKLDESRGMWERAAELLLLSASLRFDRDKSREMRMKAAALYAENRLNPSAIKVYMTIWQRDRDDVEVLQHLNRLLEEEHRYPELITVKTTLLQLIDSPEEKITLRLEIAKLAGILEGSDRRIELLKANLKEHPGHEASIERLDDLLRSRQMFDVLTGILSEQAAALAERSDNERAAALMLRVAKVYEESLKDTEHAIEAYEKVVDMGEVPSAMDALARLHISQNRTKHAITWLKRRLASSLPHERISVLLRLARAQLKVGDKHDAVMTLEEAFSEAPKHPEIRSRLLEEYRGIENYEGLASLLTRAALHLTNPATVLDYSREAAELYFYKLHVLERAVTVLERATELAPDEQRFKVMLAEALVADGQLDRSEELLQTLLEGFGRRRSKERAAIHLQLAKVAKARGDIKESIAQLELATSMDSHDVSALKTLAELQSGEKDFERAERTYRSLLLLVRRETPKGEETPLITPAEILFELSQLSQERGQDDKAKEIEESAFEAISADPEEIGRIKARMEARNQYSLLARVFEHFLSFVDNPIVRARVRSQLADILEGPLEKPGEALDARLEAVSEDPRSPALHDAAEAAAKNSKQYKKYISLVKKLIESTRREGDELKRCELLMRLATIHAGEKDLDEAWKMFEMASALAVREVDVLKLGIKLAQARGDREGEVAMLSKLSMLGEGEGGSDARADALYSLAEIHLAVEESFDEGLTLLEQAFDESPNCPRAGRILARASRIRSEDKRLLRNFEKVARQTDDPLLRLEYMELKAANSDTHAAEIREGAELALSLGENERAEALMRRILEAQETDQEDRQAVSWAVLTLADQRKSAGDLRGALDWLNEASEIATTPEIFEIGLSLGDLASKEKSTQSLAVEVFKWLLTFDPSNQKAWEPLAILYNEQKNIEGFEGLIQESLYTIEEPDARNHLRLLWAKLLLSTDSRLEEAAEVLKNIQLDEPTHAESLALLADYYLKTSNREELIEYLDYRFEAADESRNTEELKVVAIVLGPLKKEDDPDRAASIYRSVLELLPEDRDVTAQLIGVLQGEDHEEERLALREKLLLTEPDETLPEVAIDLASQYGEADDELSSLRVLKYAYDRVPDNVKLQQVLEQAYRDRNDFRGLVDLLVRQSEGIADPAVKSQSLLEIANIARDELGDLPREIEALKEAAALAPESSATWLRLVTAMRDANRVEESMETATRALEQFTENTERATFLNFRGNLLRVAGDAAGSLNDLGEAFDLAPSVAAENFGLALFNLLEVSKSEGDTGAEREYMIKLLKVLELAGQTAEIRVILMDWLDRNPEDADGWRRLLTLEINEEQWSAVVTISDKLIYLTSGEEQLAAARRLSMACALTEQFEMARQGLEHVYEQHPDNADIRAELRNIYQKLGALSEVAAMLIEDAGHAQDDAERAKLLKRAGFSYAEVGDSESAVMTLKSTLELTPEDFEICLFLIDLYMERGELDEANTLADQAIQEQGGRRSKELGLLQHRKAAIMGAYGDVSQELSWLEQAFLSNRNDGAIAIQLADLAEQMEEWDVALKALRQISVIKEDLPVTKAEALLRQARIAAYHEEDLKRGILYAKKALQLEPDYAEAQAFLEEVSED